ncbi:MAG: PDZ domain-containing protein [Gemmataceae bacterium]
MFRVRELTCPGPALALTALTFLHLTPSLPAQATSLRRDGPAVKAAFREVVSKPSESTARVVSDGQDVALGAIVSPDGYIVTKASELRGKLRVKLKNGQEYSAQLVGVEDTNDLGLLKINAAGLRPVDWRDSKEAEVGFWVSAPSPEKDAVAAFGVVSVGTRKLSRRELSITRPTAPKNNSGYLGIILQPNEDGTPTIREISSGGPAAKAGLEVGDTVLTVAGRIVRTTDRLIATIQGLRPGQAVSITVKRGSEELDFTAKLERYPLDILNRGERMNMLGSELSYRLGGFPVILQHDLVLKPSDCGGPLVDLDGKTVGINIARAGRTESYAIPSEVVKSLLVELKSGKLAPKDEMEDKQVGLLREMIRELKADLTKAQTKRDELSDEATADMRKTAVEAVADLQKKLAKAREELERARGEKTKR